MRLDFDRPFMLRAQVSIAAARKGTIVFNIDARYDFTDFHDLLLTDGAEMQRMQQHVSRSRMSQIFAAYVCAIEWSRCYCFLFDFVVLLVMPFSHRLQAKKYRPLWSLTDSTFYE